MDDLSSEQLERAKAALQEYLAFTSSEEAQLAHKSSLEWPDELDRRRVELIEGELGSLLKDYLGNKIPLAEFKSKNDGINKKNELWGFKGIKGQMFFNMVYNVADEESECDQELKSAIAVPTSEELAASRIKTFSAYVKRIGDQHVEAGNDRRSAPYVSSVPFFLSYFWQIQDRNVWPVYYTSCVNLMSDLNLWELYGDSAKDYLTFKHIYEELRTVFSKEAKRPFGLYDVEHVFWFKGGNPYGQTKIKTEPEQPLEGIEAKHEGDLLPDSYVPPIVAILPRMALHESGLEEAARRSGTSLDRAFEKYINIAFTMLGFDTQLLGQGGGRVPDGRAEAMDDSYALLWDAKIRANGYSLGTDDRTIREYINTQSRELKRRKRLRNIYYAIISSTFADDYDETIRSIKMETDVSEVCLIEADALVAMVEAKLRNPQDVTLGPDGLQMYLSMSGVLSADKIRRQTL